MSDRNYFNVSGYYFRVQRENTVEDLPDDGNPQRPTSTRTTIRPSRRSSIR